MLASVHAFASLLGAWGITVLAGAGIYSLSSSDTHIIVVAAPIAGALAFLMLSRFLRHRQSSGSNVGPWVRVVVVSVAISLVVSVVISSFVAIDSLNMYHDYMASRDAEYQFDYKHAASGLLFLNAIGGALSAFTVLPANLLAGVAWLVLAGKR